MKMAFREADGSVTILGCASKSELERVIGTPTMIDGIERRVLTDREYLDHIIGRNVAKGVIPKDAELVMLPDDWVPADRRAFRSAWVLNGETIDVDMPRAREIQKARLRREREPMLAALDTEYMRADETRDAARKSAIAAEKQALRDVTASPLIDAAKTPEELKSLTVAAILGRP